ncbi:MAG TPA: hypothetical protein DD670_11370 [Planctomycetaceae bacterium]|nr:hypothetical protein [Planctomycetaceae bacterium]
MKRKTFQWTLPPEIERRLGDSSYGRQRAIFEAGNLLLILHAPPGPDDLTRDFRVFLRTSDGKYQCNGIVDGQVQLRRLLADYRKLYDELEEAYQKSHTSEELFRLLESVAPAGRSAGNMRDALQAAREYVKEDSLLIAMRDEAYEVARNFEILLGDVRSALDFRVARNAEMQAARTADMALSQHKLNVLAAITFPLMAIATLLGMNLAHGFENSPPIVFYLVFVLGLIVGLAVKSWVTNGEKKDE